MPTMCKGHELGCGVVIPDCSAEPVAGRGSRSRGQGALQREQDGQEALPPWSRAIYKLTLSVIIEIVCFLTS